jgi:hypothetical protein
MAVQVKERGGVPGATIPITAPRVRRRPLLVGAGIAAGVLAGWLAYVLVSGGEDAARVQEIQRTRAEAMVEAYEAAWARVQPTETRIAVTGTGPGLVVVADLQRAWAENAITGTGPGLVTIAEMQAGSRLDEAITGTGPGLEHLPAPLGEEVALVGTP